MHALTVLVSIIAALATFSQAEAAEPISIQHRYDVGSAIDSYISEAGSYYTKATAAAISYASVGVQEGLSDASTWLDGHTSDGAIIATVTSVGGVAESIVTSVGGAAITLATSGAGVVTSFGGSQFTVIAKPTSTTNAAANMYSVTLKVSPVLVALVAVIGTTLLGAWLTC